VRVMVVHPGPHFSVADVYHGLSKGLAAAGAEVVPDRFDQSIDFAGAIGIKRKGRWRQAFNQRDAMEVAGELLQAQIYRRWPDVIVFVSAFWLSPMTLGVLRHKGAHKLVGWFTESPYEDDRQLQFAPHMDAVFVNDPTFLDLYRAVNPNSHYAPQSYDPDVHRPGPGRDDWRCDVAFAGTAFPSRLEFMEAVDWSGIDLRLGGLWAGGEQWHDRLVHPPTECLDNADTVSLYQSAKASWNLYRREASWPGGRSGWAMGPREVELAATGTFFLRDPRPEGDAVLSMLPTFADPGEFGDKLRWWLSHDDARQEAATAARAAVADRTFASSAARLLSTVDAIPTAA